MKKIKVKDIDYELLDEITRALSGKEDILLSIDSLGGHLDAAVSAYERIRNSKLKIFADVEGKCFSAATVLLLAVPEKRRRATRLSQFMIHSPLVPFEKNSTLNLRETELLSLELSSEYERLVGIYKDRTLAEDDTIRSLMDAEKLFSSEEALNYGFISEIKGYLNLKQMKNNTNWITKLFQKFLNEATVLELEDGTVVEVSELPVKKGAVIDLPDGVYVTVEGDVLTVEQGVIIDVQPKEEKVEEVEETEVKNEVEETEEPKEEEALAVEEVVEVVEELKEAESEEEVEEKEMELEDLIEQIAEKVLSKIEAKGKAPKVVNSAARKDFSTVVPETKKNENTVSKEEVRRYWGMK